MRFWDIFLKSSYKNRIRETSTDVLFESYIKKRWHWITTHNNPTSIKATPKMHCLEKEIYKRITENKDRTWWNIIDPDYCETDINLSDKLSYGAIHNKNDKSSYSEFHNTEDCKKWGKKLYGTWGEKYSDETETYLSLIELGDPLHISPFQYYCGFGFRQINEYMRMGKPKEYSEPTPPIQSLTHLLLIAICQAPRTDKDLILYRGIDKRVFNTIIKLNHDYGYSYCEYSFISTSLLKTKAAEHGNALLKLFLKKGTLGVYINAIKKVKRDEEEVLLPPTATFKIIDYAFFDKETKMWVLPCEVSYQFLANR